MKKGLVYIFFSICIIPLMISCNGKNAKESGDQGSAMNVSGDTIVISGNSPVKGKLSISSVTKCTSVQHFTTTGTVRLCSGGEADVASPFEGRIVKSYVSLGHNVQAGSLLFEVSSTEYHDAVEAYLEALQQKNLAVANYQRKKDLLDHGIGSKKEYEEAETNDNIAGKEYEKSVAALKLFGVDPEKADVDKPLTIKSPISGEIVKDDITAGQYLKADADPVVVVAALDRVWVVARVKEKDLGNVILNDTASVTTESEPESPIEGKIIYIGNIMDEQTRSVEVYIDCLNKGRKLKANMFVTVGFARRYENRMVVPDTAILQEEDKSYLYIAAGDNTFIRREVSVISAGDNSSAVLSGLECGERIVNNGGIYLQ